MSIEHKDKIEGAQNTLLIKVFRAVAISLLALFFVFPSSWMFTGCFRPDPPAPRETYGEFPFELTYRINDEIITVKDIYVCEYAGIAWSEANGKYREWSGYIKGTGESAILITEDADRKIFCFVGDAEFYMNDEIFPEKRPLTPRLYNVKKKSGIGPLSQKEISEFYDVEIMSWKFSEPIENSFE